MFAAVEFRGRGGSIEVAVVPKLWLTDNDTYCYWPKSAKNNAVFLELVKQQTVYQKGWSKYKVHKVLRTSENYQDVENYACDLIDGGTTDDTGQAIEVMRKPITDDKNYGDDDSAVGKENVDPQDDDHCKSKKHHQKKGKGIKRTRRKNSSSLENSFGDLTQSSFSQNSESSSKSDADSSIDDRRRKKKLHKRPKLDTHRRVDGMSNDNSGVSEARNSGSTGSKKTSSHDRPDSSALHVDYASQKSTESNNQSPAASKEAINNGKGQQRQKSGKSNRHRSATPQSLRSDVTGRDRQESRKSNRRQRSATPQTLQSDVTDPDRQESERSNRQHSATPQSLRSDVTGLHTQEYGKSNRQRSATPQSMRSNEAGRDKQESGKSNYQLIRTPLSSRNDSSHRRIFQASPETHRKIFGSGSSLRGDINDDLWFRRTVLDYLEASKSLFKQICNVLSQVLQTTQANLMGTEKPKELPDLPITDVHTFELFDQMLVDPVIKGYMKNRLMSIGGDTVRAVTMGMMRGVITDVLATQYNWAGHKDKKKFETTNLQDLICESTKHTLRKKIKAMDKDIKDAIKDWLKQATNRIKGRAKASL